MKAPVDGRVDEAEQVAGRLVGQGDQPGLQLALAGPPVEAGLPVGDELAQVIRIGAGPPPRGGPLRETGSRQPVC
jgi:hypothetical protein